VSGTIKGVRPYNIEAPPQAGRPKKVLFWPFSFDYCLKLCYNTSMLANRLT